MYTFIHKTQKSFIFFCVIRGQAGFELRENMKTVKRKSMSVASDTRIAS